MDPPECNSEHPSKTSNENIVAECNDDPPSEISKGMDADAPSNEAIGAGLSKVTPDRSSVPLSEISNEEIVAELTKDMNEFNLSGDGDQATVGESDDIEATTPEEDDFDEEMLKEWELTFTDEQKQEKRTEAVGYKDAGNELFKTNDYSAALESYSQGLQNCPLSFNKERAVLFSNRAAAKIKLGRSKSALEDCTKAIELDPEYVRAIIRRATIHEELNQLDEALADWKLVLELQPGFTDAIAATQRLPPLIEEKNEKLKTEMLDKLKSLGNMLLRPFGLSSNNFQMVPNGEGGYSVQFQK